jgi:hypothetical protein
MIVTFDTYTYLVGPNGDTSGVESNVNKTSGEAFDTMTGFD